MNIYYDDYPDWVKDRFEDDSNDDNTKGGN